MTQSLIGDAVRASSIDASAYLETSEYDFARIQLWHARLRVRLAPLSSYHEHLISHGWNPAIGIHDITAPCRHCSGPVHISRRANAIYCSDKCLHAHADAKHNAKATATRQAKKRESARRMRAMHAAA
jgi:hypothetical protein